MTSVIELFERICSTVVIPEIIREELHLNVGDQFVVTGDKDAVILKSISPPAIDAFDGVIAEARKSAKIAGLKKNGIKTAIQKVRANR